MDADRNSEAAEEFAKAAEIDPTDYESIFNAGVAFRQAGQHSRAEEFYRKAVDLKPNVSNNFRSIFFLDLAHMRNRDPLLHSLCPIK